MLNSKPKCSIVLITDLDKNIKSSLDWLYSTGSDRLTCTAQPGHGGKRSESPKGGLTSAVTELMQAIDHDQSNLIEK